MDSPSPVTSDVIPCVILDAARRSTRALYSDWPRRSMNPGATTRPVASIRRRARAIRSGARSPTPVMRPPLTATLPGYAAFPVPSTTRPFVKTRSSPEGVAPARRKRAATGSVAARRKRIMPRVPARPPATRARSAGSAGSARLVGLRTGLVHADRASVVLRSVERLNGLLGIRVAHLDEAESLGAARLAIGDDRGRFDGSMRFEEGPKRGIVHAIGEVADVQFHPGISFQVRGPIDRKFP